MTRAYVLSETIMTDITDPSNTSTAPFQVVSSKKKAIDACVVRLIEHNGESDEDDVTWNSEEKHTGEAYIEFTHIVNYEMFFVD